MQTKSNRSHSALCTRKLILLAYDCGFTVAYKFHLIAYIRTGSYVAVFSLIRSRQKTFSVGGKKN